MDGKTFEEVLERFRRIDITESFDMIVAVANGGIVPGRDTVPANCRCRCTCCG